ncbi:hypothetical protein PILCRDRAFT_816657 [Piloderma croceum F 1598]|uniref:Uncharacterized protein n=1 Tax=Piloderma croceum (strain F 1598) TaxID=765440 RepID=A0A0C3C8X5_PILCF|nr:hypothetical protein PILCRDRAFT_816657 [Piloderma croceum F 1598]
MELDRAQFHQQIHTLMAHSHRVEKFQDATQKLMLLASIMESHVLAHSADKADVWCGQLDEMEDDLLWE